MKVNIKISNNIKFIQTKLEDIGKSLYIVGGYTRESVLCGKYVGDIDLATDAQPKEMMKVLDVIKEVGKKYGTLIIKQGEEIFEITTFRKDIGILNNRKPVKVEFTKNLAKDSMRRDFTFNSIYYDVRNNCFIDPQNGIKDLEESKIRFIGKAEDRINEDALRILRFIRFKYKYNFKDGKTSYQKILKNSTHLLKNISIERIKEEFEKILLLEKNVDALEELREIGFFKHIIPEVHKLEKTPGGANHHLEGNVWIHTLMTLKELNKLFSSGFVFIDELGKEKTYYFQDKEKLVFLLTMLLHDIGKNSTYTYDKKGKIHYYKHEEVGSILFKEISKVLKFSNNEKDKISWLIKNHLRISKVTKMKTLKARKFMMHKYFRDLVIIYYADSYGKTPTNDEHYNAVIKVYKDFINTLKDKVFLTGNDIIEKYPELKGKEIKEKLEVLNDNLLLED